MEYIYVCPKCKAIYGLDERSERPCPRCGADLLDSGYTTDVWSGLGRGEKEEIIKKLTGDWGDAGPVLKYPTDDGDGCLYFSSTKMSAVGGRYSTEVSVYSDRVTIRRKGATGGLPKEMILLFENIAAVISGSQSGRAWISFSVPGIYNATSNTVTAVKPGSITFTSKIPYNDPCSVVYGMGEKQQAEKDCSEINKIFMKYKTAARTKYSAPAPVIMQESALDSLKKLKELYSMGIITEEEYNEKREKLMASI